jgi:hypothetical protein
MAQVDSALKGTNGLKGKQDDENSVDKAFDAMIAG